MVLFYLSGLALLLAIAVFFIPLLRKGPRLAQGADRREINLGLYQQRTAELGQEAAGDDYLALKEELDRDLLDELSIEQMDAHRHPRKLKGLLLGLLLVPVVAFLLYQQLGRPELLDMPLQSAGAGVAGGAPHDASKAPMGMDLQKNIDKLVERLKTQPKDLDGWLLLARSYMMLEQFEKAVSSYETALTLAPDNLDVKAAYAEAWAEANDGSMAGRPAEVIADILKKQPSHPSALWLSGIAAAQDDRPQDAVNAWKKLQSQFPPDSEDARQIAGYIAKIQGGAGQPIAGNDAESSPAKAAKSIRVKVELAPALKAKANPTDTLFIFAKASAGPPMPLAIARRKASELPIEITLDDSMSMAPGMNLSAFDQVILGARISKSGQAMPASGDLQGLSEPLAVKSGERYSITIGQEVP